MPPNGGLSGTLAAGTCSLWRANMAVVMTTTIHVQWGPSEVDTVVTPADSPLPMPAPGQRSL
jgi:hypothetical protein